MSLIALPTSLLLLVVEVVVAVGGWRLVRPVDAVAGRLVTTGACLALAGVGLAAVVDAIALALLLGSGEGADPFGFVAILMVTAAVPPLMHSVALVGLALGVLRLARRVNALGLGDRARDGDVP